MFNDTFTIKGFRPTMHTFTQNASQTNTSYRPTAGIKRASLHFCEHCRIPGHSTKRCFKLHGYPPGLTGFIDKGKKIAAVAQSETTSDTPQLGMLTVDQYNQLFTLLNKENQIAAAESNNPTNN